MMRGFRSAALIVAALSLALLSTAGARTPTGIPKSAPAFTKYMAALIRETMPQASVSNAARLRLDIEVAGTHRAADLHKIYNACHRDPGGCPEATTELVAAVVLAFKTPAAAPQSPGPTGAGLRIIVRTSAYIDAIYRNPGRNRPLAQPLAGDLWLIAVNDHGDRVEIADEADLPALKMTAKEAFMAAMGDTAPFAASVLKDRAKGRCAYVLGGDYYITSIVAFPELWAPVAHHCHDNLIVAVPDTGTVVYDDGSKKNGVASLRRTTDKLFATAEKPLSDAVFRWTPNGWIPVQ